MARAPSFYSDPHVQFLSQLLEEFASGQLQVPRFQRPLVWGWEKRRELLRSIRDGIPIGAVMVWRTNNQSVEFYPRLGPYRLASPEPGTARNYLLDGVQRLSTLYGALTRATLSGPLEPAEDDEFSPLEYPDDPPPPEDGAFEVYVDLVTRDFANALDDDVSGMMPLNIVFDSVALIQFQRRLGAVGADELVAASDEIARAFRDCKIPIIPISTDDVDMATRTFQRINSQGAKMSEAHMVHALTWSSSFDLRKALSDASREELSATWEVIDDDIFLKALKAYFGLDVYRTTAQDLSDALRGAPHSIHDVVSATRRVSDFLWEECGVPSPDFVPYSLQLVLLTDAFRLNQSPSAETRNLLASWFWMTTYGQLFAGMSGDRLQLALVEMRELVTHDEPNWTWKKPFKTAPLPRRFDFRSARAKALVFRLAEQQNRAYGDFQGSELLALGGRKAATQIVPWGAASKESFALPSNRFLVTTYEVAQFRDKLLQNALTPNECDAHVISDEARECIVRSDFDGFLHVRLKDLDGIETVFAERAAQPFLRERQHTIFD